MDDPSAFADDGTANLTSALSASHRRPGVALRLPDGRVELFADNRTLGSSPNADICLPENTISRLHARIECDELGAWVVDLGSRNGTFVDGVRVGRALLHEGARLRIGTTEIVATRNDDPVDVELWPSERFEDLIGRSTRMRELFHRLDRVSRTTSTVLIQGETGTGKDLVAQALHAASARAEAPFIVVDCAALPDALVEAELFGHARGAFTGAVRAHDGAFLAAHGGSLFLDEVGELSPAAQAKLLRALESRRVRRVGETEHTEVDVWVLAATHRDLEQMVTTGDFREDLYFRLAVIPLSVPPLRERREDLALLAEHFLGHAADPALLAEIETRAWLGNVRELRSFAERAKALGTPEALRLGAPERRRSALPAVPLERPFKELREEWNDHLEREYLSGLLTKTGWNVRAVAREAGLDRTYVHRLLRKHGLTR